MAIELSFDRWSNWGEQERIVTLVDSCHRDLVGSGQGPGMAELFGAMAELWDRQRR